MLALRESRAQPNFFQNSTDSPVTIRLADAILPLRGKGDRRGQVKVAEDIKKMVSFSQLNLKDEWQHRDLFDVIFCRNVMIYFDNDFRQQLLAKFYNHLRPGGYLILGHSESLFGLSDKFSVVGKTIHQKKGM